MKIKEDIIARKTKQFKSIDLSNKSFIPNKLAPLKAGIESKKDILLGKKIINNLKNKGVAQGVVIANGKTILLKSRMPLAPKF